MNKQILSKGSLEVVDSSFIQNQSHSNLNYLESDNKLVSGEGFILESLETIEFENTGKSCWIFNPTLSVASLEVY